MANILILTLVFPPDGVSTARIMGDLAVDFKRVGHTVNVITTTPHYNEDAGERLRQPLERHWGRLLQKSDFEGIPVYHVWMPRKGPSRLVRIFAWLGFHCLSTAYGMGSRFRPEVILAPSPPLTIGVSAWILGCRHRAPFIYNVQEIYPDVAVHLGVLRNRLVIHGLSLLENFVYRKAAVLTTISNGMKARLLEKGVRKEKIQLIPNFVDGAELEPLAKDNEFSRAYGLCDKFVVSYAGNMGPPQGLKDLLLAAHRLQDDQRIHFLLMGDGSDREHLARLAGDLQLKNLTMLPHQSFHLMPKVYAASDLSFVSQALGTSNDGIPSKVYRIMACARPVLACTDEDSDLARIVDDANCGIVVPPGDIAALAEAIKKAAQSGEAWCQRGKNGRRHALAFYSRGAVSAQYNRLMEVLVQNKA